MSENVTLNFKSFYCIFSYIKMYANSACKRNIGSKSDSLIVTILFGLSIVPPHLC